MKVQFKHELRGKLGEQQVYLISVSQLLLPLSPIVWPGFKSVLMPYLCRVCYWFTSLVP